MKKEQWKETFSDAMNEIADEYVQENTAGKPVVFRTHRRIITGIALGLAAAAAVVVGVIAGPKIFRKDPGTAVTAGPVETPVTNDGGKAVTAENCVLVKAEYPERVITTEDYNSKVWQEKNEETMMLRKMAENYKGKFTDFTKKSVKALLQDGETNPLGSPANFYLSLAMLAEASEGETRQEVLDVLGIKTIEELREITNAYWNVNYNESLYEKCLLASSIWLNQGFPYQEKKLETFRDQYYASVFQGPMGDAGYNQALQDWINDQTGDLLADSLKDLSMDPQDVMNLVTTVYYKATWSALFNPEATMEGVFHGVTSDSTVSYMRQDGNMTAYYAGEKFGAISLRCGDSGEMLFFLPDEGVDVRSLAEDPEALSLMADPSEEVWEAWEGKTAYPIIHLYLPKFDISSKKDLKTSMQELGIEKAFSVKDADFSGILDTTDPVFLSQVQNNLRVAIDENGVTAASMIDMMLAGAAIPQNEIDFRLDRPFLFALRSDMGDLLFVGIVEQF